LIVQAAMSGPVGPTREHYEVTPMFDWIMQVLEANPRYRGVLFTSSTVR
jgi:hypothetical protein